VVEYIGLVVPINVGGEVEYRVNLESGNQDTTQFYDVDLLNELGEAVEKVIRAEIEFMANNMLRITAGGTAGILAAERAKNAPNRFRSSCKLRLGIGANITVSVGLAVFHLKYFQGNKESNEGDRNEAIPNYDRKCGPWSYERSSLFRIMSGHRESRGGAFRLFHNLL